MIPGGLPATSLCNWNASHGQITANPTPPEGRVRRLVGVGRANYRPVHFGPAAGYASSIVKSPPSLVLASTSRYRKALLERLRIPFDVSKPDWDEVRLGNPADTAQANATGKARSVAATRGGTAAVLGSDQVCWCDGVQFDKPMTAKAACTQLRALSGREHELHTAVALVLPGGVARTGAVVARMRVRPLTSAAIASYVATDQPLDCAGSYRIESLGIVLFEYVRCDDPTSIEGLPLIATARLLEECGWTLPAGILP